MRIPAIAITLLVAELARAQGTPVELRGVLPPENGVEKDETADAVEVQEQQHNDYNQQNCQSCDKD